MISAGRIFSIVRGTVYKVFYHIDGGKRLELYSGVHFNNGCKKSLIFGNKVAL